MLGREEDYSRERDTHQDAPAFSPREEEQEEAVVDQTFQTVPLPAEDEDADGADVNGIGQENIPSISRNQEDNQRIETLFKQYRWRILVSLWILGVINNLHYNLVISAADSLAAEYGMKRLVALISFANVFFGIVARIINAFVANRVSFNLRMTIMVLMTITGLFFTAFSSPIGGYKDEICFLVVIIGVCFSGTAYSYGECVALTYLQRYPSFVVGAWGSGTGASGVITSVMYIVLTNNGVSKQTIFLASSPLTIIYWLAFCVGLVAPQKVISVTHADGHVTRKILYRGKEEEVMNQIRAEEGVQVSDYDFEMFNNLQGLSWRSIPRYNAPDGVKESLNIYDNPDDMHYDCCRSCLSCCPNGNFIRRWWHHNGPDVVMVHKTMWWFYLNVAIVYVGGYAAQFMAPFSFYCSPGWESNFFVRNSYPITQVCYQVGVFLSRSSLAFFKIKYVGVLTILQTINAILWLVQAKTLLVASKTNESKEVGLSFILFALMMFVGLVGGASYVNCFFLMLSRSLHLQEADVESRMAELRQNLIASPRGSPLIEEAKEARKPNEITGRPVSSSDEESSSSDDEPVGEDNLTVEQSEKIANAQEYLKEFWQRRRELAMATGSLYGMVGICCGTILDVIFTNTLLKNTKSSTCGS